MADWLRVQGTSTTTGSGTSNNQTFGAAVTSGNMVVGAALLGTVQSNVVSVADDKGNAYRIVTVGWDTNVGLTVVQFRSLHLVTNKPTTITVTVDTSVTVFWLGIEEFSPPTGTTDISLSGQQYMGDDSGAVLPNFQVLDPDCLVWGVSMSNGVSTTGAGFNAGQGTGTNFCTEWAIRATATNTMSVVFATQTGQTWAGAMAIAPVGQKRWEPIQRAINRTGTGLTATLSFPNAVGIGNVVCGAIAADTGGLGHLTTLQDDKGNSYPLVTGTFNQGQGTPDRQSFWSGRLLGNGPRTLTATYNASQTVNFLQMCEFAPPPGTATVAIDGTPVNANGSSAASPITTPNVTTTRSADLAFAWADIGTATPGTKPNNSYSAINGEFFSWMTAYWITGAPGTVNFSASFNVGAGGADTSLFILLAVPGGGSSTWLNQLSLGI